MFGVSQMENTSTPSKQPVRRARPVHSCLDCRNRKLKCDRNRPCGQCAKGGRPNDCHYDSSAGSMSRTDGQDGNEPASKRRRTEDGDMNNGFEPGNWGLNTPASVQYGAYGNAGMPNGTNQPDGHVTAMANMAGANGAQQAYSGSQVQRQADVIETGAQALPGARLGDRMGVVEDLQARVSKLEKMMRIENAPKDDEDANTSKTGAAEVLVDLRHSHSSAMNPKRSIVHQFEDMAKFYHGYIETSTGMEEVHRLRALFPKSKQPERMYMDASQALSSMLEMIPPKGDCDRLLKIYLNTWNPIHQILDLSHFLTDYQKFWRQASEDHRSAFAPALLLVVAIGSSLDDASQSQNPNFLNNIISYVETWLIDLSSKRQKDIEVLCVHALLTIAMQCAAINPDRIYRMTGSLARSAMLMGLHYDPRVVSHKADERQIQHRRQLWTSIVELDLQASLQVGTPPAVRDSDLRINATVLANPGADPKTSPYTSTTQMPNGTPHPANLSHLHLHQQPTLQAALAKTLKTRLLTGTLTLDVYPHHDFAAMRARINAPLPQSSGSQLSHIIADSYIQRSILAITRAQIKGQNHRVVEGCLASTHSSMALLAHLSALDPNTTAGLVSKRSWNLYVNLFTNDIYRAALVICLIRKLANGFPPYTGAIGDFAPHALIQAAERALHCLLKNLDDFGNHIRDLLTLTLALESVRPEAQDDAAKWNAMKAGFEFLKQQLYERQPILGTGAIALAAGGVSKGGNGGGTGMSPQTSSSGQTPLGNFDLQFLAEAFNFDFDFSAAMAVPAGAVDPSFEALGTQAVNFGGI